MSNTDYIIKYVKAFKDFESYLKKINNNFGTYFNDYFGYLINLESIDKIKTNINYDYYKNLNDIYKNYNISPVIQSEKKYTIDEIEFRNSDYLLNMIFNENKYIIINADLWKLLCIKGKEEIKPIKYSINYSQIKFKLNDQKELFFSNYKNNKNLMTKEYFYSVDNPSYYELSSNYDNIVDNIYKPINDYYEFHNNFIKSLNNPSKREKVDGYIVDIDWFKEWEKFHDFNNIKSKYLDKNSSKKEIIDYLIHYTYSNKIDINQLPKPIIYKFSNTNEIKSHLHRKKNFIIVNQSLIISSLDRTNKLSSFYLYQNNIQFNFKNENPFLIKINNNTISLKNDDKEENIILIQLIKMYYFKKKIIDEINKEYAKKDELNEIILIKKDIIKKYLDKFNYDILSNFLEENFKNLNYSSLEKYLETTIYSIKTQLRDYYGEITLKEGIEKSLNFEGNEYILKEKPISLKDKILMHIDDFDVIDKDIFSFFVKNNIIKENQVIKGQYIAGEGKYFLCYNYNNFQIGSFNMDSQSFTTEYIIEGSSSNKDIILKYFKTYGIKLFLQKKLEDKISIGNYFCYCYEIRKKDDDLQKITNSEDSQYNLINIVSTLINLYLFENDMQKKIEISKNQQNDLTSKIKISSNPLSSINCILINGKFLAKIKKLFDFQKIIEITKNYNILDSSINDEQIKKILQKNESYKKFLLDKKDEFIQIKKRVNELFKIEKITKDNSVKDKFQYPLNFGMIKEHIFDKFCKIFDLNNSNLNQNNLIYKPEEALVSYNNGNIVFRGLKYNFCGNYMSLLYIYSLDIKNDIVEIKSFPKAILNFKTDQNLNKQFSIIMKEDIMDNLRKIPYSFSNKYDFDICLIINEANNDNNNRPEKKLSELNESSLYDNDKNKYYNQLIYFSFLFYMQYKNFYDSIKEILNQKEEKVYLINKKYIDEIKSILHMEEIANALNKNDKIEEKFLSQNFSFITLLKENLKNEVLIQFFTTKKNEVTNKLNNPILYDKISKNFYENSVYLFYYENFQIINKKIVETLEKIDPTIKQKCITADCILSKEAIILKLYENSNYILNFGRISKSYELVVEFLIQSDFTMNNDSDIETIFSLIKVNGYTHFKNKYMNNKEIMLKINHNTIFAKIYRIYSENNNSNNLINNSGIGMNNYLSEKLKAIILLAISQNIDINIFNGYSQKKIEKVYLMNPMYLNLYKYNEIFSLIKENKEIKELVDQINNPIYPYDSNILEQILSKLNNEQLIKYDKNVQIIDLTQNNWEARPEQIKLKDKTFNIYKEFILIKEKIFNEIKSKLLLSSSRKEVYYTYNDGDILAIKDYYDYNIFFGKINNEENLFSLRYILSFNIGTDLKNELRYIQDNGIKNYVKEKTILNLKGSKNITSPIFNESSEIGKFYIYTPGIDYSEMQEENNDNYLNSENFTKIMNLYDYYEDFKINGSKGYVSTSYYLINKDIMNSIKKDYKYEIITQTLNKIQLNSKEQNKQRRKLLIFKNLPEDYIKDFIKTPKKIDFIKTPKKIDKCIKDYVSPEILKFNIPDSPQESLNIYKNFEIISPSIASQFIHSIYNNQSFDDNFIECFGRDGKIIIYYPKHKLNNELYVYEIGNLNDDNTFVPEYLIIYKKNYQI